MGEIVVSETPNWLNALEQKREQRLKAKLGHEAGAGAPCLKCADKCPGLDLHFWRKACKICRCPKEEHDVHDDDIYGWAQFQLLGSKPNKIKTKIVLPGKKDEVELEWAPKGNKETIDKYLKTLPPERLPVKGSKAAQDRKQLLQKQIPIHDIDPTLCHELNEDELKKMNDYIAHVKKTSVGVGQIVSLGSIIKGNLHNLGPQEAAIIASRYSKGISLAEIVKLQGQDNAMPLLQKLQISEKNPSKNLPNFTPNSLYNTENVQNPFAASKIKDINVPTHAEETNKPIVGSQFSKPFLSKNNYEIDEKLLKGTNFNPKNTPSQFVNKNSTFDGDLEPNLLNNVPKYGFENPYFNVSDKNVPYNNLESAEMLKNKSKPLPNYAPQNIGIHSENIQPKPPKNIKDLVFSTYDQKFDDKNQVLPPFDNIGQNFDNKDQNIDNGGQKFDSGGHKLDNKGQICQNIDNKGYNDLERPRNVVNDPRNVFSPLKPLSQLKPDKINTFEDVLEPHQVNIGAIKDIYYPEKEIYSAVQGTNDFYDSHLPESLKEILNDTNLPNCHYCKKKFEENEFAVSIDRANVLFHSECFKCAGCNQSLADNVYFYHKETDNVYCGRDYAKIRGIPRCKACDELIFTKEYCLAENSTFHLKHFCCIECDTPLAGQDYTLEDENPYCLPCFERSKAAKCGTCFKVIKPDEQGCQLKEIHFHASDECFSCFMCRNPLMGKKLLLRHDKLFCSHDCLNTFKI